MESKGYAYFQRWRQPDKPPDRNRNICIWSCRYLEGIRIVTLSVPRRYHVPYLVVFLEPSSRASLSMVMACAGQMASQSLQAEMDQ